MTIRVLQVGLGPIGVGVMRQILERPGFELVAAVDIDPTKVGRDVGAILGLEESVGITVEADLAAAVAGHEVDAVALCTLSALEAILPQLETILAAGRPIVSTTEELPWPAWSAPELTEKIDAMARQAGAAVVGTGVNPGFAMDTLPIVLTAACERVDSIRVDRIQDASPRRLPFQQKIGAGLTREEFLAHGGLGHVGLTESIAMIAGALGWKLDRITDDVEPWIVTEPVSSGQVDVAAGNVAGIRQDGFGYRDGEPLIHLHMEAYIGAPESYDAVRIEGSPPLYTKVETGIPGDIATASVTVNTIPRVIAAPGGLWTMKDLPIPGWWAG